MKKHKLCTILLLILIITATSVLPAGYAMADTGVVKGGWLILRSDPSFSGTIKSSYPSGTTVTITGQVGSWYAVKTPDGKTGYMLGDYLQTGNGNNNGNDNGWDSGSGNDSGNQSGNDSGSGGGFSDWWDSLWR